MIRFLLTFIILLTPATIGASSSFPSLRVFNGYPSYVRVGNYDYTIHYVGELYNDEGDRLLGMCNLKEKKIYIKIPDQEVESTLVHEFIHAMVYENGFDMDERSVLKMETALYRFLKDNYQLKPQ